MFSTVLFVSLFLGLQLIMVVLWALFLRLGLHWAQVPDVTKPRIVLTTAIVIVLNFALNVLFLFLSPSSGSLSIALGLVELAVAVIVPVAVIGNVFKVRFLRAFLASLPTILASITTLAIALFIVRPFLYEAYVVPTNAMAPTLVGQHWRGTCPECKQPNYCSPRDVRYGTATPLLMICDNFHVTDVSDIDKTVHSGDHFLVAKFLTPRRWDLVVFQSPEDPSTLYVKRLIGFPGERIHIQDDSVWVDGKRQTPPDAIDGIEYLSELPGVGPILSGSANRPALLGNDEYFVLGDFSAQSSDSRLWQHGAPGYNQYAVPKPYIWGVVTNTFWPLKRWRIHR